MADLLKDLFNQKFIEDLGTDIQKVYRNFRTQDFVKTVLDKDWNSRELKQRMRHITSTLFDFLPKPYSKAINILVQTTVKHRSKHSEKEKISFCDLVFPDFVEVYGLEDYDLSISALEEFTKVSSSESAIRHFIVKYPDRTIKQMLKWAEHENPMVRRLASEGSRPRLPWTIALEMFKKDPSKILPILEKLKEDESEFVRRSVANNLNDISKDHPDILISIAKKWIGKNPDTDKLLKHASRTLLKKGNPEILQIFGFSGETKEMEVQNFSLQQKKIKIGDHLFFQFDFSQYGKKTKKIRLEYCIEYQKKFEKKSKKVFIITEKNFSPGEIVHFELKQSFQNMTTRVHYPGVHSISIKANGIDLALLEFTVLPGEK